MKHAWLNRTYPNYYWNKMWFHIFIQRSFILLSQYKICQYFIFHIFIQKYFILSLYKICQYFIFSYKNILYYYHYTRYANISYFHTKIFYTTITIQDMPIEMFDGNGWHLLWRISLAWGPTETQSNWWACAEALPVGLVLLWGPPSVWRFPLPHQAKNGQYHNGDIYM